MRTLVLGAGGVGGYFGGRLADAGTDVTFLVRPRRASQIAEHGLVIETPTETRSIPAKTATADTITPDFDVVLLSCKAYDLDSSIEAIKPAVRENTRIVPLLNGMSHLAVLDGVFGAERIMGGSCQIAAQLASDGTIRNLSDTHNILWGVRDADARSREVAEGLAAAFARTPVNWKVSDDVIQDMWEKLVFLCTLAAMTASMRATIGDITATPDGRALLSRMMNVCIDIATREGHAPRDAIRKRYDAVVQSVGSPLTASMLRDVEAGNQVEADHIVGYMLGLARKHGLDDTLLAYAYTHLKAYERRRTAGGD